MMGFRLPARARPRQQHQTGRMNKLEARYAREILDVRKAAGEIAEYWFEAIKIRLADRTFYTSDFLVQLANGEMELHETKGFMEDDAAVKLKVVAEKYPFRLFLIQHKHKEWSIREVGPAKAE